MDWSNIALDFYNKNNINTEKIKNISGKISNMFYPAPNNTDIADMLYRGYNKGASNIVEMTPDEYLRQSYNTYHYNKPTSEIKEPFDLFLKRIKQDVLSGNTSGGNLLYKIMRGQKLDMPELTYNELGHGYGQEGNHRAMAAKLAGEHKIPVAVTTYAGDKGVKEATKKNILKSLRFGKILGALGLGLISSPYAQAAQILLEGQPLANDSLEGYYNPDTNILYGGISN